jgi:hypothetical protein
MDTIIQDHEQRLIKIEGDYLSLKDEVGEVKAKLSNVENVNLQTQNIVLNQNKNMQDNFDKLLTGVIDIKKTNVSGKYSMFAQLFTGFFAAGGVGYGLIELVKWFASK